MVDNSYSYSDIVRNVRTKHELDELDMALDSVVSGLFQLTVPLETLLEKLPERAREQIRGAILGQDPTLSNRELLRNFFIKLKEELAKVRILEVTLAFEPRESTIEKLATWVRTNLGEGIVLRIAVDTVLLAGAVIIWKGTYVDMSAKAKLEKLFEAQKPQLASLVK